MSNFKSIVKKNERFRVFRVIPHTFKIWQRRINSFINFRIWKNLAFGYALPFKISSQLDQWFGLSDQMKIDIKNIHPYIFFQNDIKHSKNDRNFNLDSYFKAQIYEVS